MCSEDRRPVVHPASLEEDKLMLECELRFGRGSGPGGQHRNKVETAVVVTHLPSGVRGEASERRSQAQNRRRAMQRLRTNLALEIRSDRIETVPSEIWQQHCRSARIAVNREHPQFPTVLAEALDVLHAEAMEMRVAAQRLGTTTSQLVKLLQLEPRALKMVNDWREQAGLSRLR